MSMTPQELVRYLQYADEDIELVVITRAEYARLKHIEYQSKQLFMDKRANALREALSSPTTYERKI